MERERIFNFVRTQKDLGGEDQFCYYAKTLILDVNGLL